MVGDCEYTDCFYHDAPECQNKYNQDNGGDCKYVLDTRLSESKTSHLEDITKSSE